MKLYTIGFTQKTAREFFGALSTNKIDMVLDIRLNNKSQLAGFAKGRDLKYFLSEICQADYMHEERFAPTKELLDAWKKENIGWCEYEAIYNDLLRKRKAELIFAKKYSINEHNRICLLCSEATAEFCHRRLLAEYLLSIDDMELGIEREIIHL